MSLPDCIPDLLGQGKIAKGSAQKAQDAYDRHFRRLRHSMGDAAAAAEASEAALKELEYAAALTKRQTLLQVQVQQGIMAEVAAGDRYGTPSDIVERVHVQKDAIVARAHSKMQGILEKHSRNMLGEARDKSGLRDIVRELFDEESGNLSAKELAGAWRDTAEMLRQRFNRAGGNIAKRADWGLPQTHDTLKIRAAGYDRWRAEIIDRLDLNRMVDQNSGGPFTAETIEDALHDVYQTLRSDGWNTRSVGAAGQGKIANRRADPRFLVFKSADDWIAYQDAFGTSNAFDAMMGHTEGMARDIALMEGMGPNPAATLRWMQDHVKKAAALDPDPGAGGLDKARSAEKALASLYDVVSGNLNTPVNGTWARRMGSIRSVLTSAFLGSASLSAITDVGFQATTRAYNGLPVTGAITDYLRLFNPADPESRRIAVRIGLMAQDAARSAASLNRFIDGQHGGEVAKRLSDAVLRASGLSVWTQRGKWAFGMGALGHLADVKGAAWEQLDPALRGMMERHGIGASGWDAIRQSPTYRHEGAEWVDPTSIADEALGDRVLRMILTETNYAVPETTARSRAIMSFGQQPGTLGGEIIRNGALFKSFGVAMILTHGQRMMELKGYNRLKYFAGLSVTTTLLGALALQMKEISKGKDAQDMTSPAFWGRAALQGGGYGIFGDFIGAGVDETSYGHGGFAETVAGPVVGAAADVARNVGGNLIKDGSALWSGEESRANWGKSDIAMLKRYMPGGSLWYARAAYERAILDHLAEEIDPDYADSWSRMEDRAASQGQEYFWRPGDIAPDRLPTIAKEPQ